MSTKLHDPITQLAAAVALSPRTMTGTATGPSFDLADADGPVVAAVLVGTLAAGTVVAPEFEQSANGTTWAAVAAVAPAVSAGNSVYQFAVPRSARYLRCVMNVSGPTPSVEIAVLAFQQKKVL